MSLSEAQLELMEAVRGLCRIREENIFEELRDSTFNHEKIVAYHTQANDAVKTLQLQMDIAQQRKQAEIEALELTIERHRSREFLDARRPSDGSKPLTLDEVSAKLALDPYLQQLHQQITDLRRTTEEEWAEREVMKDLEVIREYMKRMLPAFEKRYDMMSNMRKLLEAEAGVKISP